MNEIKEYTEKIFEDIKHIDEKGNEYWYARGLQSLLEYSQWRRFEKVINKAKLACKNLKINVNELFANVGKLSKRPNNAVVEISDYKLSRYACYLIAQNVFLEKSSFPSTNLFCYSKKKTRINRKRI